MSQLFASVISLGCDKNRVDTERMLFNLGKCGVLMTNELHLADVIIVNTCAFIVSARRESIDTVLRAAQYKKSGRCRALIVCGCFSQKHFESDNLFDQLGEVDAFLGVGAYDKIQSVLESVLKGKRVCFLENSESLENRLRVRTTPQHYAYLKIADGCNNHCTYCTIPSIRGKYRSRSIEGLVLEATELANDGVRELILVAQDVTAFGQDSGESLVMLLKRLVRVDGIDWIRLMYCYPERVSDELIDMIANEPRIAKYIDIPIQHASDDILKKMGRRFSRAQTEQLFDKIRAANNQIAIRTTFIVGFPTESWDDFMSLCSFVEEYKPNLAGAFIYSREEGTPAYKMTPQVPLAEKKRRLVALEKILSKNAIEQNTQMIGRVVDVVYEDIDYKRGMFFGRTQQMSPDVDNLVFFSARFADVGKVHKVRITGVLGADLLGEAVEIKEDDCYESA